MRKTLILFLILIFSACSSSKNDDNEKISVKTDKEKYDDMVNKMTKYIPKNAKAVSVERDESGGYWGVFLFNNKKILINWSSSGGSSMVILDDNIKISDSKNISDDPMKDFYSPLNNIKHPAKIIAIDIEKEDEEVGGVVVMDSDGVYYVFSEYSITGSAVFETFKIGDIIPYKK